MSPLLSDTELLERLVGFDTVSRNSNLPLADFICDYLDRPGVDVLRNPSPDGQKTNLAIFVGPAAEAGDHRGLMLSGHMDVVPADEPDWHQDPFQLTDTGEHLVGRGSADMKGFVALAVNRAARAAEAGLEKPLVLILTYDEEVGTLGARHFRDSWSGERPLPTAGIIGEPTSLRVIRMHKGHLKMRVSLTGVPAHSGYPHLGVSAIEPAARVIDALAQLRRELEAERPPNHEFFPAVPYVALNVGTVHGGSAVNVIPEHCVLELGARILPGMTAAPLERRIRDAIAGVTGRHRCEVEVLNDSPPLLIGDGAPICRHLCQMVDQESAESASYATDAGWLQQLELDCVIFGPGSIEVAHKPNEFMPKDEFQRGGELLDRIIHDLCGGAS